MKDKNKPVSLNEVLSERKLAEWLDLNANESTGVSRPLGYLQSKGLPYCKVGTHRFYFAQDVIDYLWARRVVGVTAHLAENDQIGDANV